MKLKIKLSYITGLKSIVLKELRENGLYIIDNLYHTNDSLFLDFKEENISKIKKLRSVSHAYIILCDEIYNPIYLSKHKSVLGNMINTIITLDKFKTFKISCAGSDSFEIQDIKKYIKETFYLNENINADLKIHIIKPENIWEIGIQITSRPLSVRDYKVINMPGAMDSTIAYAINSLCDLDNVKSYLNIFSGSATLLIEAGLKYPNLETLIGFDNNKKHLSLSIQNIKKANLIKRIQVREADIFDKPDLGKFDVIVSDLPFGMLISKDENLESLYKEFINYCESALNKDGKLVIYTSEYEIIEKVLSNSKFNIVQSLQLKLVTNVDSYLRPKIIICEFKKNT